MSIIFKIQTDEGETISRKGDWVSKFTIALGTNKQTLYIDVEGEYDQQDEGQLQLLHQIVTQDNVIIEINDLTMICRLSDVNITEHEIIRATFVCNEEMKVRYDKLKSAYDNMVEKGYIR